jgi:hypothetical protein
MLLRRNPSGRYLPNLVLPPMAAMLASGLWHEASPHMIIWGALHGAYQACERLLSARGPIVAPDQRPRRHQRLSMAFVFALAVLTWLPFRTGLAETGLFVWGLFAGLEHPGFTRVEYPVFVLVGLGLWLDLVQHRGRDELAFLRWSAPARVVGLAAALLAIGLSSLGVTARAFVYQEF